MSRAAKRRQITAVELTVGMWIEGPRQGLLHNVVLRWHKYVKPESTYLKHWDEILKAQALLRDGAHKVTQLMIDKWMLGDLQGLLFGVFGDWRNYTKHQKRSEKFTLQVAWAFA